MEKQFAIICEIMELKFQKNGRINNIEILKEMSLVTLKLCNKQKKKKFQIKGIIMILKYKDGKK